MKITNVGYPNREVSLAGAVECVCGEDPYTNGAVESVRSATVETGKFIGKLVEVLHTKGLLSSADISKLLEYHFDVAE